MRLADIDLGRRIDRDDYENSLEELQHQLRLIELAYRRSGQRVCIVFEGWDAAGKGGTIRRLTAEMDPRGFQVWPIAAPGADQVGRHYLERFWQRLPAPGVLAVFDRSWYGRVLVERVEGFARPAEWQRAYDEINRFEKLLTDDGVRIVKLFIHISADEQQARFRARYEDPLKRWKLTVEDFRNAERRDDYERAIDEMLERTSTDTAPWAVIAAEQKRYGRIEALGHIARELGRDIDLSPPEIDPETDRIAREIFG